MTIFKCKMCGGTLEINNETVAVCEYCGTKQTLPKLNNNQKANLYDRANHLRRNNEFDKAIEIYEKILNEDNTDAEAYWSLVLCRYGIEYVEDPTTHKQIPTVNRTQFTSVLIDEDYKAALQYADVFQRSVYENEAKAIDELQKGILSISQKEEPFDVFICYKETDNSGRRTPDSVLANDLYHQLTQEGFHVFFSRITLEDKIGSAYEPYIFAALNSAKVMVVLGTKQEYFNAAWVKNEWSRYLDLIKKGAKKMLIPAYKDMDPYDLPEEFSHLQAQDMSKLGFIQDIIRGIKKIIPSEDSSQAVIETTATTGNANITPLLKRVFMFLEDGDFSSADEYCEKVLDINPETPEAYLGKLMAELRVNRQEELADCDLPFDERNNYKKAIRFADNELKTTLTGYIDYILERNENIRLESIYNHALDLMNSATDEGEYRSAATEFSKIPDYKDSDALSAECMEKAEITRKDTIYNYAKEKMSIDNFFCYKVAIKNFETISGWRDSDEQAGICYQKMEKLKAKEEEYRIERERQEEIKRIEAEEKARREDEIIEKAIERRLKRTRRIKKISIAIILSVVLCVAILIIYNKVIIPNNKYNNAVDLMNAGRYEEATAIFFEVYDYRDSAAKLENCCIAMYGEAEYNKVQVGDIYLFGSYEQDNDISNGTEPVEWLVVEKRGMNLLLVSKYGLDCQPYNTSFTSATWENSSLRQWLNEKFINTAFSSEEQKMILPVTIKNNKDSETPGGKSTTDKVFLLSVEEAEQYFPDYRSRWCEPTSYAQAQGADDNRTEPFCRWWLRSIGSIRNRASYVSPEDGIYESGAMIDSDSVAVRPVLWINLEQDLSDD